jgi:hypothetical protein
MLQLTLDPIEVIQQSLTLVYHGLWCMRALRRRRALSPSLFPLAS